VAASTGKLITSSNPDTGPPALSRARRGRSLFEGTLPYLFILPTFILIGLIIVYPLLQAIYLSLLDVQFIKPVGDFVGLKNLTNILQSPLFWLVARNSAIWTVVVVLFQFVLGLATALLLNQEFRGRAIARALIILPWVTPGVITGLLWRLLLEPNLGIVNGILATVGVANPNIPWLSQASTAMIGVIVSAIWKGTPFSTVMYLAALQGVPEDLIDAAKIDGATGWKRLLYVIIPNISPVIRITVLLTTIWTANYFDIIYVMTEGGPLNQTHIFPTYIYELAFRRGKTSMASAFGLVTASLLLVLSLWYVRELNRRKALD
jgi:ABC-type sugar transport system permease subunit